MTELPIEKIEENWRTYEKILSRLEDSSINKFLEVSGERLAICPLNRTVGEPGSYPGGLVEHSLRVASAMRKITNALDFSLPLDSILKVSLLHDIGKIGAGSDDLFVPQDSDWHREKLGQMYKFSETAPRMSMSHRTLFLLQKFEISLSREEWIAIQISGGPHYEENRFYVNFEPTLAILLQKSKSLVSHISSAR